MIKLNFNRGVWRVHLPNGVIHVTSNIETAFAVIRDYAALTGRIPYAQAVATPHEPA